MAGGKHARRNEHVTFLCFLLGLALAGGSPIFSINPNAELLLDHVLELSDLVSDWLYIYETYPRVRDGAAISCDNSSWLEPVATSCPVAFDNDKDRSEIEGN